MNELRTASGKMSNRMSAGLHPGLPAPVKHVPFGGDCPYQDAVGLKLAHLEIVLALLAFAACGECSSSVEQLNAKLKRDVQSEMSRIRGDWVKKVGNGWGSGPMVWDALTEKYRDKLYPGEPRDRPSWMSGRSVFDEWGKLWKEAEALPLEPHEWNVLSWTFDNAMVKGEDLETFVASCRLFAQRLRDNKRVCHLPQIADRIEELLSSGQRPKAICHYHTSVSENPWLTRMGDDDYQSYDINADTKHWFVTLRPIPPDVLSELQALELADYKRLKAKFEAVASV